MEISAKDVAALREKTGVGMMDCKKALTEAGGDFDKAEEILREKGLSKVRKRSERAADEGKIVAILTDDMKNGVMLELNSETDFVARTDDFVNFAEELSMAILQDNPSDSQWQNLDLDGETAGAKLDALSAKLGEKLEMRRFVRYEAAEGNLLDAYIHGGGKLGVMLEAKVDGDKGKAQTVMHDLAMQIAAASPSAVCREEVPSEEIEKELEIYRIQARNEGKPEKVIDRIAEGKIGKYFSEICLLEQPFVKEPKTPIADYLKSVKKEQGIDVDPVRYERFALGGN